MRGGLTVRYLTSQGHSQTTKRADSPGMVSGEQSNCFFAAGHVRRDVRTVVVQGARSRSGLSVAPMYEPPEA